MWHRKVAVVSDPRHTECSNPREADERNIRAIMKSMCPSSNHRSGFVATLAVGHMKYVYTLLVPMNQRVLNKQSKERNVSDAKNPRHTESLNFTEVRRS